MIEYRETINLFNKIFIRQYSGEGTDANTADFIMRIPKDQWVLVRVKE